MDAINDKAFAALGAYPIIQSAVAITILLGALYLVVRATRDKPRRSTPAAAARARPAMADDWADARYDRRGA